MVTEGIKKSVNRLNSANDLIYEALMDGSPQELREAIEEMSHVIKTIEQDHL